MADNVFISGSASGALAEAFNGLPEWASEKTLLDVQKYLRKSLSVQTDILAKMSKSNGSGNSLSPDELKKVNSELGKTLKNLKNGNEEDKKVKKTQKDLLIGNKLNEKTGGALALVLTNLAVIGGKVLGTYDDYITAYDALFKSGINVMNGQNSAAGGFQSLNEIVNLTGLRLQTLQKVAEKYSSTVNAVGMLKFSKAMGMANSQLQGLGYNSEAQANLIGTLLEAEKGYADVRDKSAQEIADDAVKLGNQMSRLSLTVGMSREQLEQNLKATAKSTDAAIIFARFGKDAADAVTKNAAGIKDSGLRDMMVELAAATNPAQVKGYNDLVQAGLGDVAQQMFSLAKGMTSMDPVEFQKQLSAMAKSMEQQTGRMGNLANLKGGAGDAAAKVYSGFLQQGRDVSNATEEQKESAIKTQAAIARFQTAMEKLGSTLQRIFFPLESAINRVAAAVEFLNTGIDYVVSAIDPLTRSFAGVGLIIAGFISSIVAGKAVVTSFFSMFGSAGAMLGTAVNTITTVFRALFDPVGKLLAAFTAGFAIGTLIYDFLSKFEWFNSLMDTLVGGFVTVTGWIGGTLPDTLKSAFDPIFSVLGFIGEALRKVIGSITGGVIGKLFGSSEESKPAASNVVTPAKSNEGMSVPKSPTRSTVESPSTQTSSADGSPGNSATPSSTVSSVPPTQIKKPEPGSDINNLLTYQGSLLQQILLSMNNLVSVNKDMLRYIRNSA